jgi:very-short-patch-repair endonuclease
MPRSPTISEFKRKTARRLRQNATDAEMKLWRQLKRLERRGTHFRKQMPIGNFIVDFACPAARLVIEVDGSQHGDVANTARDRQRTQWLESEGYRVLRFWNSDITQNIAGVMETIYAGLYGTRDAEPQALKHRRRRRIFS